MTFKTSKKIVTFSINHPKIVSIIVLVLSAIFLAQFPKITIDTDPENMLSIDNPVRLFHDQVKQRFGLNDLLVLGIIREDGIFQKQSLKSINRITEKILALDGVITEDVLSFITTDSVESGAGLLNIHRIMSDVPEDSEQIKQLQKSIYNNEFLVDKLAAKDGKGVAIYIPIEDKSQSYRLSQEIEKIIAHEKSPAGEEYYLAGLPIAEDTFGHEMFVQMAISAPLAALIIFLIMLYFFRQASLIVAPLLVAVISIAWTMGLLIGSGFTVHIMSSMIPIFLMPIAVVDSVHVLSEFHERYPYFNDKKQTLVAVMEELFTPMLFTSIT